MDSDLPLRLPRRSEAPVSAVCGVLSSTEKGRGRRRLIITLGRSVTSLFRISVSHFLQSSSFLYSFMIPALFSIGGLSPDFKFLAKIKVYPEESRRPAFELLDCDYFDDLLTT